MNKNIFNNKGNGVKLCHHFFPIMKIIKEYVVFFYSNRRKFDNIPRDLFPII